MAQINRKAYLARDDVESPRFYIPFTHSDHSRSSCLLNQVCDCYGHMCCSLQCITSQVHRRCTCMICSSFDCDPQVLQSGNGCDNPKINTFIEQHTTLLDV